jgi:hypothetical protein
MSDDRAAAITKATSRKSLFHFTRASNLPAIAQLDMLLSSFKLNPEFAGERRLKAMKLKHKQHSVTINAHLKISDSMIDAAITQEQFRACLDRHVFFWPTIKDCQKMMGSYARREPGERFAVLEFDAYSLLSAHYSAVKLSKYDSGSSPRFPTRCTYKKSLDMFIPLDRFQHVWNNTVPVKASEIHEVLIEDRVSHISSYLRAVWIDQGGEIPDCWRGLERPLSD